MHRRLAPFALALLASLVTGSCCVICVPLHPADGVVSTAHAAR